MAGDDIACFPGRFKDAICSSCRFSQDFAIMKFNGS